MRSLFTCFDQQMLLVKTHRVLNRSRKCANIFIVLPLIHSQNNSKIQRAILETFTKKNTLRNLIMLQRASWESFVVASEMKLYFTKRVNAILFFHKSSILSLTRFHMRLWISVSLNFIKFTLQAFLNLHNFKICIYHSGQILFLIFI